MTSSIRYRTWIACFASLAVACGGCMSTKSDGWKFVKKIELHNPISFKDKQPEVETPVRLVSSWSEATLTKAGEPGMRGFGGRLMFFTHNSDKPVRVRGQLVVYAFDENREEYETQPSRRYVFPAEEFALHESDTKLGPSYSVWLPWDKVGGEQKSISLIARFEPIGAPLIVGDQTRNLLPGAYVVKPPSEQERPGNPIRLAGHEAELGSSVVHSVNVESGSCGISVPLPKRWQERILSPRQTATQSK